MSQQLHHRLSESQKWPYIPNKNNLTHFFMLGCTTPGMPILEQLEYDHFIIFSRHA